MKETESDPAIDEIREVRHRISARFDHDPGPLTCLTLGLFHFVISALMLLLVAAIPFLGFQVSGIVAAFLGAIVIAIVGTLLSWILPD